MSKIEGHDKKLEKLRAEHRQLDDLITQTSQDVPSDQLRLQRLKKRKLILKDQISALENQMLPDIIA